MEELRRVEDRLEALQAEVTGLKRQRWFAGVVLIALLALGVGGREAQSQAPQDQVTCRFLSVVGPDGKERTRIGGGMLLMKNNQGATVLDIAPAGNSAVLRVLGGDGKRRVTVGTTGAASNSDTGYINFFDSRGLATAALPAN
jgi:hypothetical protein